MIQNRTYTIRLFPTKEQIEQLNELSVARNLLYNVLIGIEEQSYKETGKIKTEFDLCKDITHIRKENLLIKKLNAKASQRVAKEIYSSYKSFFNLFKKDKTARPPKHIDDINNFHTISFNQSGWVFIDDNKVKLNGIMLEYKGKSIIDYKDKKIKEVKLKLRNGKYLLDLNTETLIDEPGTLTVENKVLAIDLGIKNIVNGVDNKGHWVTVPNKAKKINKYFGKHISEVQSKMDKCTKGSNRYKKLKRVKSKLYNRKNSQIKQTLHIQSKKIVNMNYKTIVVGDLEVKKLIMKDDNKKRKVSKSFNETAISTFMDYLSYKCRSNNIELVKIGEQWTTQQNCLTGKLFKEKINLNDRIVRLNESIIIDRDLNAAINILRRYEQNHIALVTEPLDVLSVVCKYNLQTEDAKLLV